MGHAHGITLDERHAARRRRPPRRRRRARLLMRSLAALALGLTRLAALLAGAARPRAPRSGAASCPPSPPIGAGARALRRAHQGGHAQGRRLRHHRVDLRGRARAGRRPAPDRGLRDPAARQGYSAPRWCAPSGSSPSPVSSARTPWRRPGARPTRIGTPERPRRLLLPVGPRRHLRPEDVEATSLFFTVMQPTSRRAARGARGAARAGTRAGARAAPSSRPTPAPRRAPGRPMIDQLLALDPGGRGIARVLRARAARPRRRARPRGGAGAC